MADPSPFDDFEADVPVNDDAVDLGHFEAEVSAPAEESHAFESTPEDDVFGTSHEEAKQEATEDHTTEDPFASAGGYEESQPAAQELPSNDELSFQGPTPLSVWENERAVVIQNRISKAKADKQKALEDARAEIAQFYKQREEGVAKKQATNREDEKNLKTELEGLMKNGTLWEKVGRLSNLQPKANDDRKVARMRKLLVTLKNDRVDENLKSHAQKPSPAVGKKKA